MCAGGCEYWWRNFPVPSRFTCCRGVSPSWQWGVFGTSSYTGFLRWVSGELTLPPLLFTKAPGAEAEKGQQNSWDSNISILVLQGRGGSIWHVAPQKRRYTIFPEVWGWPWNLGKKPILLVELLMAQDTKHLKELWVWRCWVSTYLGSPELTHLVSRGAQQRR